MESTSFLNDFIDRSRNSRFVGHISGDSEEPAGEALGDSIEIVTGLSNVNRIDLGCTVGKTALSNTKADTAVGTGN
jgi:hypothetical protein